MSRLPVEVTSFVGRRRELAEARRLLSEARLITLTGAAGVGKTRLAVRVAGRACGAFPDGVWLAELDALHDPGLLAHTVATVFGLGDAAVEPAGWLAEYLEDKRLLLVLDNCEHLVDDCAILVGKLLASARGLRVLTTSRTVLGIDGEQVLRVPPLPVPEHDDTRGRSPSVSLFVDRARSVDPEFVVDERNREQVVAICRRLDGVPLAIELAAAWVSTLAPGEILARLGDRFQLLTKGSRVAPSRQQTLADAIGWSYHLCSESEQQLWSRLSVFAGGFDLEAAEEVCAGDGLNRAHVLGLIAGLVDKSVLIRQLDTHRARARYRMLETIRQYGVDRLAAAGQETLVRTRHAVYYRKLAQRFQAEIFGPHQLEWIQRVLCEHPNIRTALEFSLTGSGQIRTATEIASALWNFWWGGCFGREGYRWLERALSVDIEPTGVRGRALATCAHFGVHLGETGTARRMLAECAQLAEQLDDPALRACYAENAGHAAMHRGELREAYTLLEQAVIRYREVKDRLGVANSLLLLASSALFLDDPRGARAAVQALELCEAHNASWTKSYALRAVALNKWRTGDHREGIRLVREAIRLQRAVGDRTSLAYLLEALAWCTSGAGEHDRAARLLGAAMLMWRLSGAKTNKTSSYEGVNEQLAKRARMELGEDRFQAEVDQGLALTIDGVFTEALSERASGKAGHGRRRGTGTPLTRREMQIAELVAQGLTNKEVAIRLVIAQRTVEAHVGNVFSKLGLTSRAQIATWIAKHRDNIDVL